LRQDARRDQPVGTDIGAKVDEHLAAQAEGRALTAAGDLDFGIRLGSSPSDARVKANALQKPLQPSEELAAVVGSGPLPRGQVVSKMWDYIRSHNLQNAENRREILADDKLRKVFGKDKVTMFEMNKHLAQHLK
jgi:chromatin remodeling complex protein RSC6